MPLKHKKSLRDYHLAKLKREGKKTVWNRNGTTRTKRPLKKVSRSQREKLKTYYAVRDEWLAQPENENCHCCEIRRNHGEDIPLQKATECHHRRGRNASLLTDTRFFVPTCYDCGRNWIHVNPRIAREYGLLAPASEWNVVPR